MLNSQRRRPTIQEGSKSVGKQIFSGITEMDMGGLAKAVAYDILFALAPLLIFVTALAGWVTQLMNSDHPNPAEPVLQWMTDTLPPEAASFLKEPIDHALRTSPGFLLSFGALFALWGAKNALSGVIRGLNAAYGIEDSRSWLAKTGVAVGLTIAMALLLGMAGIIFVLGTQLGQDIAGALRLGHAWTTVSTWLRWPVIVLVVILAVALIHRFGPNIEANLKWFLPGAIFTVVTMMIATLGLGLYFSVSGGYAEAYGAFGAVLAFIFWLWLMCLLMLLGGVINMAVQKEVPAARRNVNARADARNDNEEMLHGGRS